MHLGTTQRLRRRITGREEQGKKGRKLTRVTPSSGADEGTETNRIGDGDKTRSLKKKGKRERKGSAFGH